MRIRKYDFDYGRRKLMEKALYGTASVGVLSSLWPMMAHSDSGIADMSKAYPDELTSIELYTKGKIKPGDTVTSENVEHVKDMLDPIAYEQVLNEGRRLHIVAPTDLTKTFPKKYLEATLRNRGKAMLDDKGNVRTKDGGPWIGGNPFPEPKTALETMSNLTLSWGRNDWAMSAIRDYEVNPSGNIGYQYDFCWTELQVTSRADGKVFRGEKDKLRYNNLWFTHPNDTAGTSFLNTWAYDQNQFPDLQGFLPAFRRVRQFPTNQRFEPLVPGSVLYLSDAWAAGDPVNTWGNFKIVGRKPMLGSIGPANFMGGRENWDRPVHGGPKGNTFHDVWMEMVPECIVLEAEPVGYPRAPVSKRRIWVDARNMLYVASVSYDRRGDIWKSFEPQFAQYSNDQETFRSGQDGDPAWSWTSVLVSDHQDKRVTRFHTAKEVRGGFKTSFEADPNDMYQRYMTEQALVRLGRMA